MPTPCQLACAESGPHARTLEDALSQAALKAQEQKVAEDAKKKAAEDAKKVEEEGKKKIWGHCIVRSACARARVRACMFSYA